MPEIHTDQHYDLTSFAAAMKKISDDVQLALNFKASSFCCGAEDPALPHIREAESLSEKASHEFARAAAMTTDNNVKLAVRSAHQEAINSYANSKQAEIKLTLK